MSTAPDLEDERPVWLLALEVAATIAGATAAAIWIAFDHRVIRYFARR